MQRVRKMDIILRSVVRTLTIVSTPKKDETLREDGIGEITTIAICNKGIEFPDKIGKAEMMLKELTKEIVIKIKYTKGKKRVVCYLTSDVNDIAIAYTVALVKQMFFPEMFFEIVHCGISDVRKYEQGDEMENSIMNTILNEATVNMRMKTPEECKQFLIEEANETLYFDKKENMVRV